MRPPMPPHSNQFPHYQPPPVSMAMPPQRPYGPLPPPGQQVSVFAIEASQIFCYTHTHTRTHILFICSTGHSSTAITRWSSTSCRSPISKNASSSSLCWWPILSADNSSPTPWYSSVPQSDATTWLGGPCYDEASIRESTTSIVQCQSFR